MKRHWPVHLAALAAMTIASTTGAAPLTYQRPPKVVAQLVDAKPNPYSSLGPDRTNLLLITPRSFPSIAEIAEPELRLAGVRINPMNRSVTRRSFAQELQLLDVRAAGAKPRPVSGLPADARLADFDWSPDGKHVAFTVTGDKTITLWTIDVAGATAAPLSTVAINGPSGNSCTWLPDSSGLVCLTVPLAATAPPANDDVPRGPIVQENEGEKRPVRTNPNLLTGPVDEGRFEYFFSSQITLVGLDGKTRVAGTPGLYTSADPSPDGKYLLVQSLHRPFSYQVGLDRFPLRTDVWTLDGKLVNTIADLPLAENIPVDFDAVRTGRRSIYWRGDVGATLCWAEARDGGDPKKPAKVRDEVACQAAPFTGKPQLLAALAERFRGVTWGSGSLALVTEFWWKTRHVRTQVVAPDQARVAPRVLWDRSYEDRYNDPGTPVMRRAPNGSWLLQVTPAGQLLLLGDGATAEGERPFLDRLDVATGKSERMWRSEGEAYSSVAGVLDDDGTEVLVSRETVTTPPQLYLHSFAGKATDRQLTRFPHPVPELAKVTKQLVRWKRKDGLELSGMLYLPTGFRPGKDKPLPVLVWVYPSEYKSAAAAAQVQGSPYQFAYPWWGGPMFALTQGYAVVDDPSFAIVGEGKTEPNDTYVEQLTSDAAGLIDEVVRLGVGDRDRFAVGGHSYGAFTTVNLLAHSNLFRTGIARSGAYNRTLTPFGFQQEERTYWEAPETYLAMSPFNYAHKIDEPLLLIHGAADDNSGTYTIQSDRLFAALQGLGGIVRYVLLPAEAHGYRARESALHVLWEQVRWLDAKVKNAKPRATAQVSKAGL